MNEKDDSHPSPSENDDKPVSVPRRTRLRRWLPRLMFVMLTVSAVVAGVFWWQEHSLAVAETALQDGEIEYALYLAENFLENRPSHVRALSLRARALVALRSDPDEALRIFDEVGAASAEEVHAWAQACLMKHRWSQALPLLVRSVQMTPTDPNAIYELAICRTHLGQLEEALKTAQRMVKLPDNEARGQVLVGTIHGDMGNFEGAAEAYASVLQYEPEGENLQVPPHSLFLQYGRALLQSGKPAASIGPLKISVSKIPTADAFVELGEAASQLGKIKNAELAWKEALNYSPLDRQARESLANSALQALAAEDALKWLVPLEEVPGMRVSTAFLFQRTFAALKDSAGVQKWTDKTGLLREKEQFRSSLDNLIVDAPNSFWARAARTHDYASDNNWEQAESMVDRLLQESPGDAFIIELADAVRRRSKLPAIEGIPVPKS